MKMYNTLSNALTTAQAENGPYNTWGASGVSYGQFMESYFVPNLKISKKCNTSSDCGISDTLEINWLNSDEENDLYKDYFDDYNLYILSDGAILAIEQDGNKDHTSLFFDTNGLKGPNTVGRDAFYMDIRELFKKYVVMSEAMVDDEPLSLMLPKYKGDDDEWNCTMEYSSTGVWCPARLLLEGKMDY